MARSKQRHPFAGAVRIRARELIRRPTVVALFLLQVAVVAVFDGMRFVEVSTGVSGGEGFVLRGLRLGVLPGGVLFGVLAATVVGAEFNWATERALLARDPRRPRFVALQLTVVFALMVAWILVQTAVAVGAGTLLRLLLGPIGPEFADPRTLELAAAALAATTVFYGLLGAACALGFRGGLAGTLGVLTYGLLGELVLRPRWGLAANWTVYAAGRSLAGQGEVPLNRALAILAASAVVALLGAFLAYAGREVRD